MITTSRRRGHSEDAALALAAQIKGEAILAPLTRGGTPPFRALCVAHGAKATMGEMAFAKYVLRDDTREVARLRKHPSESLFGAQIATNRIDEGVEACERAAFHGAAWVDLNAGCPIFEATRRGLGSALLRKPAKLARLVQGLVEGSPIPVSVKIRTSHAGDADVNYDKILDALGALPSRPSFVTLHGRTATARYQKPASWAAIDEATRRVDGLPVVGNGDVLTHFECRDRKERAPNAHAILVGRGALITPWLFDEIAAGETWLPSAEERIGVYYRLSRLFRAHFGDDQRGKQKAWYFFPWHFNFFSRWRPLPEAHFADLAAEKPLIQSSRDVDDVLRLRLEGPLTDLPPLERLLRSPVDQAHLAIADLLWEATSEQEAVHDLERLASPDQLQAWDIVAAATAADARGRDTDENEGHRSASSSSSSKKKKKPRSSSSSSSSSSSPKGDAGARLADDVVDAAEPKEDEARAAASASW